MSARRIPVQVEGYRLEVAKLGKRMGLRFEIAQSDGKAPWIGEISVVTPLPEPGAEPAPAGHEPIPATVQLLEATQERPYPILRIVAAPGMSVRLRNVPRTYLAGGQLPAIEVYRVQDPALVPPMASDVVAHGLVGSEEAGEVNEFQLALPDGTVAYPPRYVQITREPAGARIFHPYSGATLHIEVNQLVWDGAEAKDAGSRFLIHVSPTGKPGSSTDPLVVVVKTPDVRLAWSNARSVFSKAPIDQLLSPFAVFEVPTVADVPSEDETLAINDRWRPVTSFERIPSAHEELTKASLDIAVGAIPVVGDIADIAEVVYGIATGRDRWGRRVTTSDLIVMGLFALVPLIGIGALRHGPSLLRRFGARADTAEDLLRNLERANLSGADRELVSKMQQRIIKNIAPTPAMFEQLAALVRKVHGHPLTIEMLYNAERTGFTHAGLQKLYREHRTRFIREGRKPWSPRDWAQKTPGKRARDMLKALLGEEIQTALKRVPRHRPVSVRDIPRPVSLTRERMDALIKLLDADYGKTSERLDNLLAQRVTASFWQRLLPPKLSGGHFRILKGNIGEVLSMRRQMEVLTKLGGGGKSNVFLISGVRMRLMGPDGKLAKSVLFTDNVVATMKNGRLEIKSVFEVKSGFEGGLEAQEQVFKWIEGRITDGSQVVLPKGAKLLKADGTVEMLKKERAFTYKPMGKRVDEVTGLANAERHLITARGSSYLGVDSPLQVPGQVTKYELELTSAEMDYLTGQYSMRMGL